MVKLYKDTFPKRLRELIDDSDMSLRDIAADMGISFTVLSDWQCGNKAPRVDNFVKIADYFDVSCDWLLGLSDTKKINMSIRGMSELTGLHPETVEILHSDKTWTEQNKSILSDMIENGVILEVIRRIRDYEENIKIAINCPEGSYEKEHALEMADVSECMVRKALLLYTEDIKQRIYNGTLNF